MRLVLLCLMILTKSDPQGINIRTPDVLCFMLIIQLLYILRYRPRLLTLSTPIPHFLHCRLTAASPSRSFELYGGELFTESRLGSEE